MPTSSEISWMPYTSNTASYDFSRPTLSSTTAYTLPWNEWVSIIPEVHRQLDGHPAQTLRPVVDMAAEFDSALKAGVFG